MKHSLKLVTQFSLALVSVTANAQYTTSSNSQPAMSTYAYCKMNKQTIKNKDYYDVYMGWANTSTINYTVAPGPNSNNKVTPNYTTLPTVLPGAFPAKSSNNYAFKVLMVGENNNLTWHVNPTNGKVADSNTCPERVEDLKDCTQNPLPVELTSFTTAVAANPAQVDVRWTTASEINSDYFDVQTSVDGTSFTTIAQQKAGGNSTSIRNYQFTTLALNNGIYYFRLKQVDLDGSIHYSPVSTITVRSSEGAKAAVYPTIVNAGVVHVDFSVEDVAHVIQIFSASGQSVLNQAAMQSVELNLSGLAAGQYFLKITSPGSTQVERISIQ